MASGVVLALSMPKPGLWPMAWVGLIPLLVALRGTKTRQALLYGLVTGAVYYGIIIYWLTLFGYLPWVMVVLAESIFMAVFAVMASRLMPDRIGWRGYLAIPAAWTAMQWARCLGPFAFIWGSFAHTQANNLPIIQFSSITGPWGIEFLLCFVNLALARMLVQGPRRRRVAPAAAAIVLSAGVWIGGSISMDRATERPETKVAIIQGNVGHAGFTSSDLAPTFREYTRLSLRAAAHYPDLIVWPETTITSDVTDDNWGYLLSLLAKAADANLIVGGYDPSDDPTADGSHNSAFFYDRAGRKIGVYHKVQLVPYGEFVPLREQLPWLERYGIRDEDVLPGKSHRVIKTDIGKIGVSICFESLFPRISRIEAKRGASALVVITNDDWFQRTQAARQHLMMAKLRAVENRRYVVRAAATGISAVIDPAGRIVKELGIYKRGIVSGKIAPLHGLTPYARFGDWFAYGCLAGLCAGLLLTTRTHCGTCKSTERK